MTADALQPITSRNEFQDRVRALILEAARLGADELWWVDADFAHWPLDERDVIAALTAWAHPPRRLTMLARHYDEVRRSHPRFVAWRRDFGHVMHCREVDVDASDMPTLLRVVPGGGLQLVDRQRFRGHSLRDESEAQSWREAIDALMQRSRDGFPSTTLGI